MTLRLTDLEKPLDDVEFPNGEIHKPVPFGKEEYRLWRDLQTETDAMERGRMLLKIVTACYPKATVDDIDSCTPKMLIAMAAHAGRKIEQIREALKNVDAVGTAESPPTPSNPPQAATPPLSPKPSGSTSSRATRKRSGKTRGASTTASPTDGQSSSGTGTTTSKNPDESTPFSVNWTTSTERTSQATP